MGHATRRRIRVDVDRTPLADYKCKTVYSLFVGSVKQISTTFLRVYYFLPSMKNIEVAKLLFDIAELLEMQGVAFKPRAYQNAARTIESLSDDIEDIAKQGKLMDIPGVGRAISEKIEEYLKTGKLAYLNDLKKEMPMDVEQLSKVQGLGPKRIKLLYDELKIKTLADLKKAAEAHKIQAIKGLGPKVEEDILKGIAFAQTNTSRALLGYVMPQVEELRTLISRHPAVGRVEVAGSYRRRKETIGDIDILVTSKKAAEIMDFFVRMKDVANVLAKGETRSSVQLHNGMQVDLRVVKENEFGSAMQYFTGSKEHNVEIRKIALKKGLTLSEYGLFTLKDKKWVAGKTEEDIYKKLGIDIMPPEMRENMGELKLGAAWKLPKLIEYGSCHGDFQTHSMWSDGTETVEAMATAAQALGWKFITITDHVGQLGIANPLNEKRLEQQALEIAKLNDTLDIRIFHGAEVDILKDGKLALSSAWQKKLDVVLASVHLATKMTTDEMTARVCRALSENRVHILGHPTGRLLNQREGFTMNWEQVFETVKSCGVHLDIDCSPERMDLPFNLVKAGRDFGCSFSISTDAHSSQGLHMIQFGESIARRGWLSAADVLNTRSVKEIEKVLGRK